MINGWRPLFDADHCLNRIQTQHSSLRADQRVPPSRRCVSSAVDLGIFRMRQLTTPLKCHFRTDLGRRSWRNARGNVCHPIWSCPPGIEASCLCAVDVPVAGSIDRHTNRDRFGCPGSGFRPLLANRDRPFHEHPIYANPKPRNSAIPRRRPSHDRASGE